MEDNQSTFNVEVQETESILPMSSDDQWVMNCGASAHMTHRRELFSTFQEITEQCDVSLANQQGFPIKGIGTVKIKNLLMAKVIC